MAGILSALEAYQKPAKKHKVVKKGGEKGSSHSQVGELDDEYKEPTPAMRMKRVAKDEKVSAVRKWVSGEISTKHHNKVHQRANHVIKNANKYGRG